MQDLTQDQARQIELILIEASAVGLRFEVEEFAKRYADTGQVRDLVEAYELAYEDWIKWNFFSRLSTQTQQKS